MSGPPTGVQRLISSLKLSPGDNEGEHRVMETAKKCFASVTGCSSSRPDVGNTTIREKA
jgi:hypothetical protein